LDRIGSVSVGQAALVDYANPLRGSNAGGAYSYGATVPAVSLLFGFAFYTLFMPKQTGRMLEGFLNHNRDEGRVRAYSPKGERVLQEDGPLRRR
jgi:hypothetical protein